MMPTQTPPFGRRWRKRRQAVPTSPLVVYAAPPARPRSRPTVVFPHAQARELTAPFLLTPLFRLAAMPPRLSIAGRVVMKNPAELANDVLPRYFRHSKFSSFQRQLNNFGFRKIEGKGKLVPCT